MFVESAAISPSFLSTYSFVAVMPKAEKGTRSSARSAVATVAAVPPAAWNGTNSTSTRM